MKELERVYNYRYVDESLATSGQPSVGQLQSIADAGFATVINLALHDDPRYSLPDEPGSVAALGMKYVHIPVQFTSPTQQDLLAFFDAMDRYRGQKVWVHCAANMRVSAFVGLYRVLRQGWQEERAFELLRSVWEPNQVWSSFISTALQGVPGRSCSAEEVLRGYFHAKDENRPALLDRVFAPDSELIIHNKSANISFPAATRGRSAIAGVLVRTFTLAYENVYSFYLRRPRETVREFECPWLVGMSERSSGLPRVGCGTYAWSFEPDPPHLASALVISIEVMEVAPVEEFDAVFAWLRALEYPWSSCSAALQGIPRTVSLAPIAGFLERHAADA